MPYITREERERLEDGFPIATAGQLNFKITKLIHSFLEGKGLSYQTINDIVGALDGAKAEFQRRIVIPYEDKKIEENGDV